MDSFPWQSKEINPKLGGKTAYGDISVEGDKMTIMVNSEERADTIKLEIEERLGNAAKLGLSSIEPLNFDGLKNQGGLESNDSFEKELPAEILESIKEQATVRKKAWFDGAIPMLDGQSPREAAKTEKGREKLKELLEFYSETSLKG